MARAVIGGLITSTLLTLVVVPVAYTYFDDFGGWVVRVLRRQPKTAKTPARERSRAGLGQPEPTFGD
jgi:HAE1 family hydrophobic/amphiphilic exporter-1